MLCVDSVGEAGIVGLGSGFTLGLRGVLDVSAVLSFVTASLTKDRAFFVMSAPFCALDACASAAFCTAVAGEGVLSLPVAAEVF